MDDLIRRDDLVKELNAQYAVGDITREIANDILIHIPSAELEQKKGEWVLYESRLDIYDLEGVCTWGKAYRCSECSFIHWVIEDFGIYSFCPNCGARMEIRNNE